MRVLTCLVAVGLAAGTTGCIEMAAPGLGGMPFATSGLGASPYAMSPYAMSPYAASAMSPFAASPYAASPYAMSPYAASPYGGYQRPVNNYYTTYQPPQTQYVPVQTATPRSFAQQQRRIERRTRDSDGDGIPDFKERRQERREQRRAARNG